MSTPSPGKHSRVADNDHEQESPMIDEQPRNSENVFRGTSVTFSLKATGEMPLSYQWEFLTGEKPKREYRINGATLTMDKVQKPDEGYYRCIVSDCNEKEITSESATLELADQLTGKTLATLQKDLKSVTKHWEPIGNKLINKDTIAEIRRECKDEDDCMRNVLKEWLETKQATWDVLVDALKDVGGTKQQKSCTKLGCTLKEKRRRTWSFEKRQEKRKRLSGDEWRYQCCGPDLNTSAPV